MEKLILSLRLIQTIRASLERGRSLRIGIQSFLENERENSSSTSFCEQIQKWLDENLRDSLMGQWECPHQKALFKLLELGLNGASIYREMTELEGEYERKIEQKMEELVLKLPFQLLIPMLLFQLPAFLILLLGPLLGRLTKELGGAM